MAAVVLVVGDELVRLALLGEDGEFRADWFELPAGEVLPRVGLGPTLARLRGRAVRVMQAGGEWGTYRVAGVEVDPEAGPCVFLETGAGRLIVREVAAVGAVAAVHVVTTWQRDSAERAWRVKPSGRALGFRPTHSVAGARCGCGWSAYAGGPD